MKPITVKSIKCAQCGNELIESSDVDGGTWLECPFFKPGSEHTLYYYDPTTETLI